MSIRRHPSRIAAVAAVAALTFLGPNAPALAQEAAVVEIEMLGGVFDARFDPVGVAVAPGTTIRFVNVEFQHSSRAYAALPGYDIPQRIPDGAEAWVTPVGTDAEIVLTVEGVYDYYDLSYELAGMVGRIVVGDPAAFPARDPAELSHAAQDNLPPVDVILAQPDGVLSWDEWEALRDE